MGAMPPTDSAVPDGAGGWNSVDEIPLTHERLGGIDVAYAFGQGSVAGKRALVVVTEHADGTTLSVRPNPEDRTGSE